MKGRRVPSVFALLIIALILSSGPGAGYTAGLAASSYAVFFPTVLKGTGASTTAPNPTPGPSPSASAEWSTLAANPQRTSWVSEEVRGDLKVEWYRPIEPFIPDKIQPIAANGSLYISSAKGLYAIRASDGALLWVYPTELPLGNSPTVATINGKSIAYVGGFDRKIHAIDAMTGKDISGYTAYEAGAGFETNPLVINNAIYAGNRDGYFYAFDAVTGALKWRFKTDGPILFSAAYKNGIIYFASDDAHAYAVRESDGSLVWKSQKFPGAGFSSFWPVIYTDKVTGKDYVVFTGAENYRNSEGTTQVFAESDYFYPCGTSCSWGTPIGPESTAPNDGYWTPGTDLIDASKITDYFENYAYRRTVFALDGQTGQEYTFDSDNDGKMEYAPFTWSGVTHSGNKYPAIVNGVDGIYYQNTIYTSAPWVSRGDVVGWKFGTHSISRVMDIADGHSLDEPMVYSSGGRLIYWALWGDNEAGAFDVTIPYGQTNRGWRYFAYNLQNLAPGYEPSYYDDSGGFGEFGSSNGVNGKVGTTQSPPIPYQGRVYMLKGNAILAFSPTASSAVKLPVATTVATQNAPTALSTTELQQRLGTEIQKMLDAGPLRPGYHSSGILDNYGDGNYADSRELGEIFDYFQNPADTVVTLIQALPYLSSTQQQQVKTYLQSNYGPGTTYDFTRIVHIGWGSGASREVYDIPPEDWSTFGKPYKSPLSPQTTPICGSCGYWTSFPPYSFYAAWKYGQVFGNAKAIFDAMNGKLETPPSDAYLIQTPYILNLYIAGYLGYLQLQSLAGYSQDAGVLSTYNHLLSVRSTNFSKDAPWSGFDYHRALDVARNFMFMTPELADYLNQNAYAQVQAAVSEYSSIAPYWFVSKSDTTYGEGTLQPLYDYPALFQAKAYILKQPYTELVKWLDVPAFYRGDLFYIQNLVAALKP